MLKKIVVVVGVCLIGWLAWRGMHAASQQGSTAGPLAPQVAAQSAATSSSSSTSAPSLPSSDASPVTSVQGPPSQPAVDDGDEGQPLSSSSAPSSAKPHNAQEARLWSEAGQAATGFMKAAAGGRAVNDATWWWRVEPFLPADSQNSWRGYGRFVTFTKVSGEAVVLPVEGVPGSVELLVWVPTDEGAWMVHVTTGPDGAKVFKAAPVGEGS